MLAGLFYFAASASVQQSFRVDLSPVQTSAFDNSILTQCFGSSHAATALRADWREQLTQVHADLGTKYVRFHGLLDDDMSAVVKAKYGKSTDSSVDGDQTCNFLKDTDYADGGGGVYNTSSKEECCKLCYIQPTGLPLPCIASVWTPSGQCYLKLGSNSPVVKNGTGIYGCATDRKSPKSFAYSFVNIFSVFDFLVSINMRPIVEIGFMPSLLASDPDSTVFWYKGGISPPKDYADWRDFMSAFMRALIERYGAKEVHEWYFEVGICLSCLPW